MTRCHSCGKATLAPTDERDGTRVVFRCPCGWAERRVPAPQSEPTKIRIIQKKECGTIAPVDAPPLTRETTDTQERARIDLMATGGNLARPVIPPKPETVVQVCLETLRVRPDDYYGANRHSATVLARIMSVVVLRRTTILSYPEIAVVMRRPAHSTVITEYKRYQKLKDALVGDFLTKMLRRYTERFIFGVPNEYLNKTLAQLADAITARVVDTRA
jgi:hypothetical protein